VCMCMCRCVCVCVWHVCAYGFVHVLLPTRILIVVCVDVCVGHHYHHRYYLSHRRSYCRPTPLLRSDKQTPQNAKNASKIWWCGWWSWRGPPTLVNTTLALTRTLTLTLTLTRTLTQTLTLTRTLGCECLMNGLEMDGVETGV